MTEDLKKYVEELKRAEQELRKAHDELEHRVEERTAELSKANIILQEEITVRKQAEEALIQSEKMASIGTIASGIAHEINNPIGYVFGNLTTMEKYNENLINFDNDTGALIEEYAGKADENNLILKKFKESKENEDIDFILSDMKEAIQDSLDGVERVKNIVMDLKEFSRLEKPKMELADINTVIEKTLKIIGNELQFKANIVKDLSSIPMIKCDIKKLGLVFTNLLINAAQAIEKKGIIKIKTFQSDNSVFVQISDDCTGISGENHDKVFQAFFTTKEPGKGTGLGLSLSHKIVTDHNGTMDFESELGKGTTFTITLPIAQPQKM